MIVSAPASWGWGRSSGTLYRGVQGTTIAPARGAPENAVMDARVCGRRDPARGPLLQPHDLAAREAGVLHPGRKRFSTWKRLDRSRQVPICGDVTTERRGDSRHDLMQVHAVAASEERARRHRELEHDRTATTLQHAARLTESLVEIAEVADREPRHGPVERSVGERQCLGVRH